MRSKEWDWDIAKLARVRTNLVRRFNTSKDPHHRVELQCFIAAIDNVLDILEERMIEKCLIKILCDICDLPPEENGASENSADQTFDRR